MAETVSSRVRINLLGGFELRLDGHAVAGSAWPRRKAKHLLKLLALQPGHALHREQVIEALWPGADVRAGANNLNQTLHVLRRELAGPPLVAIEDRRVVLHSDVESDVDAFRTAAAKARAGADVAACDAALALYTGDLLPEDQYEDWTAQPREELAAMRRALLLTAARLRMAAEDVAGAEQRLRELIAIDPLDEEACVELMRLLRANGEPRRALYYFRALEKQLREELDVAPSPQTLALATGIRAAVALADRASATPLDVRYVASADGTSIAYAVHPGGDGVPLLYLPHIPWSNLQIEWDIPEWRAWILRLARGRAVIRYNLRGTGLSGAEIADVSIDRQVEDAQAVVAALGLPIFDIFSADIASMIAVAYAARHSARVRRLVFFGGVANGVTYGEMGEQAGLRSLMVHDYDVYADMWARAASGFDDELGPALVRWGKATPFAVVDAYWSAVTSIDTTPMLEAIDRPALMVYGRHALDAAWFALLSAMAARVAHAKLVKLDGSGMLPVAGDTEPLAAAIDEFLGARAAAP